MFTPCLTGHLPPSCHCQLRHLTATKIYSADGKVLNTVHGVVGVPREVIELTLQQCPVHADRRPQQHAAKPRLVPIVVNRAFWQCQVSTCGVQQGQVCAMCAATGCVQQMCSSCAVSGVLCCTSVLYMCLGGSLTYFMPGTAAPHTGGPPPFLHPPCCSWT